MSIDELRQQVCDANRAIAAAGLVTLAFGNVSGIDRAGGIVVIKPSGLPCAGVEPQDMVEVDLATGRPARPGDRPSSDTPTHLALYRRYLDVGGIVHTHSPAASAWAQARRRIPCLGTTHADHFRGAVPVTRAMSRAEIEGSYEEETGRVIVETLDSSALAPLDMPAVLVRSHGPFTWGVDAQAAVENAIALEAVATLAERTLALDPSAPTIDEALLERHFRRKHGPTAYYGQASARR